MKILLLSQWFHPEPIFKGLPFAKALAARGHAVEVLTGFPNYPGGALYPGYRVRPWQREVIDDIPISRVALYPSHDNSGLRRMVNYLSFGASAATLGPWLTRKPDVIYVYNLITLGLAARVLRACGGAKVVLDIQDLWPDAVSYSGMLANRRLLGMLSWWCMREYRGVDRLVTLSPGFRRLLLERGIPSERVEVIYNWCDEQEMVLAPPDPALARELGFAGRFNVVFAGTMGHAQALDAVLDAARLIVDRAPAVFFTFVGGGVEVERLRAKAADLSNVQFLPRRPLAEIGKIYALADALLVHLKQHTLFEVTIPSKIQAYLYAGKPIINAVPGDAADLVTRAGAGVSCRSEDPEGLADVILALSRRPVTDRLVMGANGKAFYERELAMRVGVDRFERLFHDVTGR